MSKTPLTDAMKDSHRITLKLHVAAGDDAYNRGDFSGAITAYQLALPHANAIHERDLKKLVFGMLNRARAKFKLERKHHAEVEEDVAA